MQATKLNPLTYEFSYDKNELIHLALMSDIHFDNPKCKRELFFDHLKRTRDKGGKVFINGDLFCFMQGKYDPRRMKGDVRPEHNKNNYVDVVIQDTVEKLSPYKDIIAFVGEGNHETALTKSMETNVLDRFVDLYNAVNQTNIIKGGYRGWLVFRKDQISYKIYYHHGYGGGGEMSKGILQHSRMNMHIEGSDAIWMGHVHECYIQVNTSEYFSPTTMSPKERQIFNIRTSAYKEEFVDAAGGFHIEKGRPPKTLGCIALELDHVRTKNSGREFLPSYSIML